MSLGGSSRSTAVGVNLFSGTSAIRPTHAGDIDSIDIRLIINSLYRQDSHGVYDAVISFTIEYKALSGTEWAMAVDANVNGKTTSSAVKEYRFDVPRIDEPYEIRVTKTSPESDTTSYFSELTWESFQEINKTVRSYPSTSCVRVLAKTTDQFASIPNIWGVWDLMICHVPSNYDPLTRTYDGIWDLTFKLAWTDNNPWCLYEFLTNSRFGVSAYFPINPDKLDFYEASQWCDELVPDGRGGTRPRYTFNTLISDARSGREQARFMAGTFNAILVDDEAGNLRLKLDRDDAALHIFLPENVVDGDFQYSFTDPETRFNDYSVSFTNPELNWQTDRRRVSDEPDIARNGRVPNDFAAVGCTNESEAIARARYKLITGLTEKLQVAFQTGRYGQSVQVYDVILLADPDMGWALTGRVKSLSGDHRTINLRDQLYLEVGVTYVLTFQTADGLITRTRVGPESGLVSSITVSEPLPVNLPEFCSFALEQEGAGVGAPKPFRVLKVTENTPDSYTIEGIEINRNKWADSENFNLTDGVEYSYLPSPTVVPSPDEVRFADFYVRATNQMHTILTVTLNRNVFPYYNGEYEVYSRLAGSNSSWTRRTLTNGDTLVEHPPGDYEFAILPKTYLGTKTPVNQARLWTYSVTSVQEEPADVPQAIFRRTAAGPEMVWPYEDTVGDLAGFRVKYHFGVNDSWGDAIAAYHGLVQMSPFNVGHLPKGQLTIMVKAVDFSGVESISPAVVYVNQGDVTTENIVVSIDEHPAWGGEVVGATEIDGVLVAEDNGSLHWKADGEARFWGSPEGQYWRETYQEVFYSFQVVAPEDSWLILQPSITGTSYSINYIPPSTVSFWGALDSQFWGAPGDAFWEMGSPLAWPGQVWAEAGERYELHAGIPSSNLRGQVDSITTMFDMADVTEILQGVVIESTGTRLPLTKAYKKILIARPDLLDDGGDAAYIKFTDHDPSLGPLAFAYNSADVSTSGLINAQIGGY